MFRRALSVSFYFKQLYVVLHAVHDEQDDHDNAWHCSAWDNVYADNSGDRDNDEPEDVSRYLKNSVRQMP